MQKTFISQKFPVLGVAPPMVPRLHLKYSIIYKSGCSYINEL